MYYFAIALRASANAKIHLQNKKKARGPMSITLLELLCSIHKAFVNRLQTDVIRTDGSRAFARINHLLLIF